MLGASRCVLTSLGDTCDMIAKPVQRIALSIGKKMCVGREGDRRICMAEHAGRRSYVDATHKKGRGGRVPGIVQPG